LLSTSVRGEAREVGTAHLSIAEEVRRSGSPIEPPAVLLSGGETTVTVEGNGCGGPNQEFALASALELDDGATVIASVDTDGIDGVSDAAGAMVDATTVNGERARASLDANDAYPFLENKGALLRSGRTGTNVNDLRVVVVGLSQ
jgi:hydroxypyruvate reductase